MRAACACRAAKASRQVCARLLFPPRQACGRPLRRLHAPLLACPPLCMRCAAQHASNPRPLPTPNATRCRHGLHSPHHLPRPDLRCPLLHGQHCGIPVRDPQTHTPLPACLYFTWLAAVWLRAWLGLAWLGLACRNGERCSKRTRGQQGWQLNMGGGWRAAQLLSAPVPARRFNHPCAAPPAYPPRLPAALWWRPPSTLDASSPARSLRRAACPPPRSWSSAAAWQVGREGGFVNAGGRLGRAEHVTLGATAANGPLRPPLHVRCHSRRRCRCRPPPPPAALPAARPVCHWHRQEHGRHRARV